MQIIKLLNEIKSGNLTYTSLSNKNKVRVMSIMESEDEYTEMIDWLKNHVSVSDSNYGVEKLFHFKHNELNWVVSPKLGNTLELLRQNAMDSYYDEIPIVIGDGFSTLSICELSVKSENFNKQQQYSKITFDNCNMPHVLQINNDIGNMTINNISSEHEEIKIILNGRCNELHIDMLNRFLCGDLKEVTIQADNLKKLYCQNLKEKVLNIKVVSKNITYIEISDCKFIDNTFSLVDNSTPNLEYLEISNCKLETIENLENCPKLSILNLNNNNFKKFYNKFPPNIEEIRLLNNKLANGKPFVDFKGYLDLRGNPITNLKGITLKDPLLFKYYRNEASNIPLLLKDTEVLDDLIHYYETDIHLQFSLDVMFGRRLSICNEFFYIFLKILRGDFIPDKKYVEKYIKQLKSAVKKPDIFGKSSTPLSIKTIDKFIIDFQDFISNEIFNKKE